MLFYYSYELPDGQWQTLAAAETKSEAIENAKFHADGRRYVVGKSPLTVFRKRFGWTQSEAAKFFGMTMQHFQNIEKGKFPLKVSLEGLGVEYLEWLMEAGQREGKNFIGVLNSALEMAMLTDCRK